MFATERDLPVALWIDTPALGDTIAAIPTLRKLSKAFEDKPLTVFTSNPSLFDGHPLVYQALHSDEPKDGFKVYHTFWPLVGKTYDLTGSKVEFRHSNTDIRQFHATSLGFSLLPSEMELDLYCETEYEIPFKDYVIIHPTHTWPTRTWEQSKWQELTDRLNARGIAVIAVGKDSSEVGTFNVQKPVMEIDIKLGLNLLNNSAITIPVLRWMMNHQARAVVTMDSGILHVAGTTDVNIIQLGSSIDPKLRAPYRNGSQDYKYKYVAGGCDLFCSSNMKYNSMVHGSIHGVPPQIKCLENKPTFECHPTVDQVYDSVLNLYDIQSKIRIVHLLLEDDLTQERQTKSIESISRLKNLGVDYIQVWNRRWTEIPPRDTFAQPERYDEIPIKPGHYGNFRAFADATFEHFTEDLDALIYVEGDAIIISELQDLVDSINEAYQMTQDHGIALFSFGSRYNLELNNLESETLNQINNVHIINKFIGAQFIMIPKYMRKFVIDRFANHVWSTADIFLNNIFTGKFDMAIFEKPHVIQADGVSAIDDNYKIHFAEEARIEPIQKFDKAYITHTTSNYEEVTINLVNSIKEFSEIPVVVFTIDYDASDELKALAACYRIDMNLPTLEDSDFHNTNGNMYVNRDRFRTYMALSSKIDAMVLACDFINEWVYLDGDCIANYNVDDLFNYMDQLGTYPLATLGPHQYVMMYNDDVLRGNPFEVEGQCDNTKCLEWPLMSYFDMRPEQRTIQYKTTNILVGNKDTKPFLEQWAELRTELPTKVDPLIYMPFHEETIYNVLVWQRDNKHLPMVYINVEGPETVEHFFNTIVKGDVLVSDFYRLTSDKDLIKVFHGEKRRENTEQMIKTIKNNMSQKKKLLYLAPHLSTGGMPQFVQTRVEAMVGDPDFDVYLLEYNQYSDEFVVQRNRIARLLGDKFRTIAPLYKVSDEIRARRMQEIITEINPDIIHIEESPESFDSFNRIPANSLDWLYASDKNWRIIETCHNIWFKSENKQYLPTGMMYCTPYHPTDNFKHIEPLIESAIVEYPIIKLYPDAETKLAYKNKYNMDPNKIHVLNTGLWTSGKNQGEGVEIARIAEEQHPGKFQFHFVGNQASNFKTYWEPIMANLPTNITIWGERNDTDKLMMAADSFMFNSTWECSPLALREAISYGLVTFARNLPQYMDTFTPYIIPFTNDLKENASILIERLTDNKENFGTFTPSEDDFTRFINQHRDFYKHVTALPAKNGKYNPTELGVPASIEARLTHPGVIRLNVDSVGPGEWSAEFLDGDEVVHVATELKANCWYSPVRKWHTDWRVRILHNGKEHSELRWQLEGREVGIQFSSSSLGDTLSWVGQMIRFKNAHKIQKLTVSTYKNWLFDEEAYAKQGIYFGPVFQDHPCKYDIGVFFSKEEPWRNWEHKYDWRTVPLGKIASDRLGITYKEERPIMAKEYTTTRVSGIDPHVVIATQSTAQAKYWNNPTGWQELIAYYQSKGIKVKHASKEGNCPAGSEQLPESLIEVAGWINTSLHFVGISSGLSWFAWALGKEVVMISGFTDPYVEFQDRVEFVNNHQVCHGCWRSRVFDRGDWNWCPDFKGTKRQHECSKEISSQQVIAAAEKLMNVSYIQL